jgi:hypothetical protein
MVVRTLVVILVYCSTAARLLMDDHMGVFYGTCKMLLTLVHISSIFKRGTLPYRVKGKIYMWNLVRDVKNSNIWENSLTLMIVIFLCLQSSVQSTVVTYSWYIIGSLTKSL